MNLNDCHLKLGVCYRYSLAAILVAIAVAARLLVLPAEAGYPFITFYPFIVISFLCGIAPGILTTRLSALAADYFFMPPLGQFTLNPGVAPR